MALDEAEYLRRRQMMQEWPSSPKGLRPAATARETADDFLSRFAITQPFDVLSNIPDIPFGQFAIKAQHSAVLKNRRTLSSL